MPETQLNWPKGYVQQGADELVFLDITATIENRSTLIDLVQKDRTEKLTFRLPLAEALTL